MKKAFGASPPNLGVGFILVSKICSNFKPHVFLDGGIEPSSFLVREVLGAVLAIALEFRIHLIVLSRVSIKQKVRSTNEREVCLLL
ncbi:MAG TPA: hypothetical protein DD379_09060 [Cyanobacteria bacterium UBA11162]|nr:hypothetical protein [Cyanobacteria bacterium UBA11162]